MERKPKISPNNTFVFDEDDIEALDDVSITSVIKDVTSSNNDRRSESGQSAHTTLPAAAGGETIELDLIDSEIMAIMREINCDK